MIDAKSILDQIVRGAGGPGQAPPAAQSEDLGSLLRQIMGETAAPEGQRGSQPDDGGRGAAFRERPPPEADRPPSPAEGQGGGLADILGQVLGQGGAQRGPQGGNLADILGQVFGQATGGMKEGAQQLGGASGASTNLKDMLSQFTDRSPEQLLDDLKRFISQNQLGTTAALGGLGALILGTRTGRSMAASAARLGAMALIGSLAYRAYQNYMQGTAPAASRSMLVGPAPHGSGFEEGAVTNDAATTYLRAMIAAAAADGRFDEREKQRILASLENAAVDPNTRAFLSAEVANPASVDDLATLVKRPEEAVQVYAAARLAIDPDTDAENAFLDALASRLGIDPALAMHIDTIVSDARSEEQA